MSRRVSASVSPARCQAGLLRIPGPGSRPALPENRVPRFTYNLRARMSERADRPVLVVEDDVSVRRPLVKFLEMHGFAVVTAETADEGLDVLKTQRVVAAVVDLRLKRGSGREVVGAAPDDVPVIIFSGVPSESAELERLRPRTRLIEKPYSLVLPVETLEEMLAETGSQNLHS